MKPIVVIPAKGSSKQVPKKTIQIFLQIGHSSCSTYLISPDWRWISKLYNAEYPPSTTRLCPVI